MVRASQTVRTSIRGTRRQARQAVKAAKHVVTGADPDFHPQDVWDWTRSKYRVRAIILLLINALLFAGLGCFTFWLRSGEYTPFSTNRYWQIWLQAFDPVRDEQITLIDYLLYPIPVDQVPMMMIIVGLVLASLTAIPILVSMLYRFPFSLIFTGIICFIGVLPWLAITVTVCCWLASWKPLRFSFRYATALIALLPSILYYAMATRGTTSLPQLTPMETAKLYVPWVFAMVGACAVLGIVLAIARLVQYRPGAIAPLLAVMFAIPVVLFEVKVGRSELHYQLLEANYGPQSKTVFVNNLDIGPMIDQLSAERMAQLDEPPPEPADFRQLTQLWVMLAGEHFAAERHEAIQAAITFRENFPNSEHVPHALYIEGRARDIRVDEEHLRRTRRVRYYHNFPSDAGEPVWRELYENYPKSQTAVVAAHRLAHLWARHGRVDDAQAILDRLIDELAPQFANKRPMATLTSWTDFMRKQPAADNLRIDVGSVVGEARKLRELIIHNRDPHQNDWALQQLLKFDPQHAMYRQNLARLLDTIRQAPPTTRSLLEDNVDVLLAASAPSMSERIRLLEQKIAAYTRTTELDALPYALFELGSAYQVDNLTRKARTTFERLVREHPESVWAQEAQSRLASTGIAIP